MDKFKLAKLVTPLVVAVLLPGSIACAAMPFKLQDLHPKSENQPPAWKFATNISSDTVSPEGVSLARQLELLPKFKRLEELKNQSLPGITEKPSLETRVELSELREDIVETIEQTRLDSDYVEAELSVEIATQSELLREYTSYRDHIVNRTNLWAFRTNGALWAVGEGLDIPTYNHPKFSISSGTVGILAGLVPSVFSALAVHASSGPRRDRAERPNLLAPLFNYDTHIQRLEYPKSVWDFLHTPPNNTTQGKSRIDMIVGQWVEDKNIHLFSKDCSDVQIKQITGITPQETTIDMISDRLNMLDQLHALINHMNRPLLELMMVVRGTKHFDPTVL